MADKFDPYWEWLKIPPEQQPPNHYRLLGLKSFESDPKLIDTAVDRLVDRMQGLSHGLRVEHAQSILNHVARARLCLSHPEKKSAYDETLRVKFNAPDAIESGNHSDSSSGTTGESPSSRRVAPVSESRIRKPQASPSSKKSWNHPSDSSQQDRIRKVLFAAAAMGVLGAMLGFGIVWLSMKGSALAQVAQSQHTTSRESPGQSTTPAGYSSPIQNFDLQQPESQNQSTSKTSNRSANELTSVPPSKSDPTSARTETTARSSSPSNANSTRAVARPETVPQSDQNSASKPASLPPPKPHADGTYPVAKPEQFESFAKSVIRIEGQVHRIDVSRSGKTAYILFSKNRGDLLPVRVPTDHISKEQLETYVDKQIRVRGVVRDKWGSDPVTIEILTVDDIEVMK